MYAVSNMIWMIANDPKNLSANFLVPCCSLRFAIDNTYLVSQLASLCSHTLICKGLLSCTLTVFAVALANSKFILLMKVIADDTEDAPPLCSAIRIGV